MPLVRCLVVVICLACEANFAEMPKEFASLTSYKAKADWTSCRAEDWTVAYCEQVLMQQACEEQALNMVQHVWLGAVMQVAHDIVVRRVRNGQVGRWMAPLGQVGNSVVIMWPVTEQSLDKGGGCTFFTFDVGLDASDARQLFVCVWDLAEWQARPVAWRSPSWQARAFGSDPPPMLAPWGIKAFATGGVQTLLEVAASQGYWRLSRTFLLRLGKHIGVDLAPEADLFATAERLAKHTTGKSDEQILGCMAQRMSTEAGDATTSIQDFLDIEDAMLCVSRQEAEELQRVANCSVSRGQVATEFKESYKKLHAKVQASLPKAAGSGAGKKKKKAKTASAPALALPVGELSQAQLKPLVPPGGSLWIGNKSGCWQSHHPPFARVSRSWHVYGHRRAAVLALQDCWEKHLSLKGQGTSACPIVGLFADDAATACLPPRGAASASSSSGAR